MSTPYMSGFHGQVLLVSAMSAARTVVPLIGVFCCHRLARNAAHHVDAELQTLGMHVIGERLEAARRPSRKGIFPAAGSSRPNSSIASLASLR